MIHPTSSPIAALVTTAESLYSLPAVAMEVLELTDSPTVDTRALKDCLERDPALTAKVLRVMNSSLFGLSGRVDNLTQAIALLGIKPLKLLVLGFSLPDELLDGLDTELLQHYWRGAFTRAVAARQLARQQWHRPGDDAFLVALLQDIGKLVLLQQLGAPYARFLLQVRHEHQDLLALERESLGFDHRALTIALLRHWRLPAFYAEALEQSPPEKNTLGPGTTEGILPQILYLANLLAELVDEHRLSALPPLLARGHVYCDLDQPHLRQVVAALQPQVQELAELLQIPVGEGIEPQQVLQEAQTRLASLAQDASHGWLESDSHVMQNLLKESQEMCQALQHAIHAPPTLSATTHSVTESHCQHTERADTARSAASPRPHALKGALAPDAIRTRLLQLLRHTTTQCRNERIPLSIALIAPAYQHERPEMTTDAAIALREAMLEVAEQDELPPQSRMSLGEHGWFLLLPQYDRKPAVAIVQEIANQLAQRSIGNGPPLQLKAGIAYIGLVPKAFDAERLLLSAEGCLQAAQAATGTSLKSIEVY